MGRFSDCATSSEESYMDLGLLAEAESGIPDFCFCGGVMEKVVSPFTAADPGRLYFRCRRREVESEYHYRRWWDNCIEDELFLLKTEVSKLKETFQSLRRLGQLSYRPEDFQKLEHDIAKLKDGQVENTELIGNLEMFLAKEQILTDKKMGNLVAEMKIKTHRLEMMLFVVAAVVVALLGLVLFK